MMTKVTGNSALDLKTDDIYRHSRDGSKIKWSEVQWEDLRKPLHSALAVHLYLCILRMSGATIPGIADIDGQATFWRTHFDTEPAEDETRENFFKTAVAECDKTTS